MCHDCHRQCSAVAGMLRHACTYSTLYSSVVKLTNSPHERRPTEPSSSCHAEKCARSTMLYECTPFLPSYSSLCVCVPVKKRATITRGNNFLFPLFGDPSAGEMQKCSISFIVGGMEDISGAFQFRKYETLGSLTRGTQ